MSIYKFRTFEDAEKALWNFHPDEGYYERLRDLWDFADRLNPIEYPKGIFKFKTLQEANEHREKWELAHAKRKLKSRHHSSA
ncbi:MAG: hypothetical protein GWN01_15050 [Nitrosopumilaceae archaeon]|nr:hypothetical protein [Nitrosopumilaceae archaeon]NIV66785.1 hypothetical protein [Nitrosopumilaceae archaeon]NIX62765.1 hypothetical protein [Nitrosopumilaceae archaeon]